MKRLSIFCFLLLLIQQCFADDYRIIAMNGQSIIIGHRSCSVDSTFNSNEVIHWDKSDVTLIAAVNVNNPGTTCLFSPYDAKDNSCSTNWLLRLFRHFTNNKWLSTRNSSLYDIEIVLTEREFFLSDMMRIRTNDLNDSSNRGYYASFIQNGITHVVPLMVENGDIIFERKSFFERGMVSKKKYVLSIYYIDDGFYHEITNGMILTIL